MLKTTIKLVNYLKIDKQSRDGTIINSLVKSVLTCGNKDDADIILEQYLKNASDFDYSYLLPVFKKFGDTIYAEQIYDTFIKQNKLVENANPKILEILGHLKYNPVKQILADYSFGKLETNYTISRSAILGLLNFDCVEYQDIILSEIEKCYGKNLFSEFIPALVCKRSDKTNILEKLFELGNKYASTDCNAGIILGFSLCGKEGEKYFKQVLFEPNWETYSGDTGTIHFTYQGMKNLNISFKELYNDIKLQAETEKLEYCLLVFFALLEIRINDSEIDFTESFTDLFSLLYKWKNDNESDNLSDLASRVDKQKEARNIEKFIEIKMNEEAILKNYISQL